MPIKEHKHIIKGMIQKWPKYFETHKTRWEETRIEEKNFLDLEK